MVKIRSRLFIIGGLVLLSAWALIPTDTTQRVRDATTGRMKDTTIRRVPLNLGLDLQGGIHLALEVDQSKGPVPDPAEAIHRAERVVRTRIDEFGTTEPVVQVVGNDRLIVELAGEKDPARAKGIIQRTAFLEFRITDMKNLFRDALPEVDKTLRRAGVKTPGQAGAAANVTQLFGADTGKGKAKNKNEKSKAAGKDTTELNAPGPLASLLYQGQLPGEFLVPEEQVPVAESLLARPEVQRLIPRGIELKWGTEVASRAARTYRALYAVEDRPIITGEELEKAQAQRDPMTNQSVVNFTLSRRGGRIFERETGRHVQDYMAIILDGRVQGQPPVIKSQIGQHGQIELGAKPLQDAQDLALVLRAGALPAPLTIVEERTIGPSLGKDSINDGIRAGVVGVVLVIVIMVGYYRLSGVLAVSALGLYVLFTLAGLAWFGFTLTLPGLAGLVLSVGIAVDANVLIFERIREELQHGKLVRTAVDEGFKHAMSAIIDSNVSTVLTAFIVPGFALFLVHGLNYSIEFTGGTLIQVQTTTPVGTGKIRTALDAAGIRDAEIQQFGGANEYVVRARIGAGGVTAEGTTQATAAAVDSALAHGLGTAQYRIVRTEAVGPKVGRELQGKAFLAIFFSFIVTLVYLWYRFEWRFGLAAVLATLHDILTTIAFIRYLNLEVSLVVVGAVLTMIGYSLNDTIIIFDRVRENLRKFRRQNLYEI